MADRPPPGPGPGPGRRTVLTGLLLAGTGLAGAGLAGCAQIPTSGPIETETDVAVEPVGRPVAQLPRPGAEPGEIVDGFLRAAAIGGDEFAAARLYLADPNVDWVPDAQVVLYTTPRLVVLSGPGASEDRPSGRASGTASPTRTVPPVAPPADGARASVVVRLLGVAASLDRRGILSPAGAGEEQRRTFGLVAAGGQWRIESLDPGLVLTLGQFVASSPYLATAVYFPDPTGRWLVPDIRYIRRYAKSTPTQIVTALLGGPAAWLAPAVTEPAPGKRLALKVSSVPVVAGIAKVELTEQALSLDEAAQTVLQLQIRDSLREATTGTASVGDVQVTVDGQPLQGSGNDPQPGADPPGTPGAAAQPRVASLAFAGSTIVAVDAKARVVVGQPSGVRPVAGLQLAGGTRPAMSYTDAGRTYALVVTGKDPAVRTLKVAEGTSPPLDVVSAPDLVTPSFDSDGWVWTAPRTASGRLVAGILLADRVRATDVPVPWLTSGEVVALRLSREGSRLVVAVDDVGADGRRRTRVLVAGVRRTRTGEPLTVGPPLQLFQDVVRASDVAWLDDRTVVVLGSRRRGDRRLAVQPWVVDVGGDPTVQGIRETAELGLIVVGADGKPLTTPDAWERLGTDVAPSLAVGDGIEAVYVGTAKGDLYRYRQPTWERQQAGAFRPAFPG